MSGWVLLTVGGGESKDVWMSYTHCWWWWEWGWRRRMSGWVLLTVDGGESKDVWMSSIHCWWWWEWGWRRRMSGWVILTVDGGESEDEEGECLDELYSLLMVVRVRMKKEAVWMSSIHCWWWWEWGWRRRLSVWILLTVDGGESEDEEGGCLDEFYSQLMVVRVRMKKEAVWMSSIHCWWWWEWGWRRRMSGWVILTVDGGESEDEEGGCLDELYSLLMVVRVRMKKEAVWMSSIHCWWWWEWGWRRRMSGWVILTVDGGESEDEEGGCLDEFYSLLMVVRVRMKKEDVWMSYTHCWWWWEWGWRRRMSGWVLLTVDGGESEDEEGGCLDELYSLLMVVRVRMKEAVWMSYTHCWWLWEWGWRRRLSVWVLLTVDSGESKDVWMSSIHCWWWWEWGWRRRMSGWVILTVDGGESEDEEGGYLDEFYSQLMVVRVRMSGWVLLTVDGGESEDEEGGCLDEFYSQLMVARVRMSGWVILTVDGGESKDVWMSSTHSWWWWE